VKVKKPTMPRTLTGLGILSSGVPSVRNQLLRGENMDNRALRMLLTQKPPVADAERFKKKK
jgi:hypothetical protein